MLRSLTRARTSASTARSGTLGTLPNSRPYFVFASTFTIDTFLSLTISNSPKPG
jgi:hypothetical protein